MRLKKASCRGVIDDRALLTLCNDRCIITGMARPREYDPNAVLHAAMRTFWKRGYEGTSIRDLSRASGLSTRSMYDAFGDKERFYEAVLDHYLCKVAQPMLDVLKTERGFKALRRYAEVVASRVTIDGCLLVNATSERNLLGPSARRRVESYFEQLRRLVRCRLEEARDDGQFQGDPLVRSAQFVSTVVGVIMAARFGFEKELSGAVLGQLLQDVQRS